MAPQFPVQPRPTITLCTPEDKAEGYTDCIRTTVLGESWNDCDISPDSSLIFVPRCAEKRPGQFRFTEVLPGDEVFSEWVDNTDPATVELTSLYGSAQLLSDLVESGSSFQFVAAPGTDREQRYRVARGGKLQKIGTRATWTPFTLRKPCRQKSLAHDAPVITAPPRGLTNIAWIDADNQPTGEISRAKYTDLSREQLMDLSDIFYALNALDAEAFALYGRVCGVCGVCGRDLADAVSINRGVGPSCWKRITAALAGLQQEVA